MFLTKYKENAFDGVSDTCCVVSFAARDNIQVDNL
jgi:hypothetical protein